MSSQSPGVQSYLPLKQSSQCHWRHLSKDLVDSYLQPINVCPLPLGDRLKCLMHSSNIYLLSIYYKSNLELDSLCTTVTQVAFAYFSSLVCHYLLLCSSHKELPAVDVIPSEESWPSFFLLEGMLFFMTPLPFMRQTLIPSLHLGLDIFST